MSQGLNRVILLGNLGADPELRMTNGGKAVLNMRLATSETFKDRNGQKQERTEWHRLVLWGNRAEALAKFLTKGDRILAEGSLRTSKYQDRDGNDRYTTEVICNNIVLSGGGSGGGRRDDDDEGDEMSDGFQGAMDRDSDPPDDDDIPF